jgi:hypothetical protein
MALASEKGAVYYAFDTLAYPGKPVDLAVSFQNADDLKGVPGILIGFFLGEERIGEARTDGNGLAILEWTPPSEGNYELEARVLRVGEDMPKDWRYLTPAPLLVAARRKDTKIVVIDLDHTVVDSSFFRVLTGGARPMEHSVEVTRRISDAFTIIYLTHRPDLLTRISKEWLTGHGYPRGPLMVSELDQAFGDSGKFKTGALRQLRKSYPNVEIGIGDKISDAQAYIDNDLVAYLIPDYKDKPKDMRKAADEIKKIRDRRGRLQVVDSWLEIEAGIFRGKKYSAEAFTDSLYRRAREIEKDEKDREKKDDDDD